MTIFKRQPKKQTDNIMSDLDPKALLAKAEKQIATAKDALAETDRIRRLKKQIEKEHAALIDTADPEDRAQMRKLGELNAELQVIPRREEKTLEKQTAAGVALCDTYELLSQTIQMLHAEEAEKELARIEARLLPDFPDRTQSNGEVTKVAQGIAGTAPIFGHLRSRITPTNALTSQTACECSNEPAKTLPVCIKAVEELHTILGEYFANRKSFAAPGYGKAA